MKKLIWKGMINVGAPVGQMEIESESVTFDGVSSLSITSNLHIQSIDGLHFNAYYSKQMKAAWRGGVTSIINGPQGTNLVSGIGGAFYTQGLTINDALISPNVSLDIHIGNSAKRGSYTSISSQISSLRIFFQNNSTTIINDVLQRKISVVAYVNQVDEITAVVRLKKEFGFKLIIVGGAEAHMIANLLAQENISVVLSPARPSPSTFDTWNFVSNASAILNKAGVKIALACTASESRNLRWEAGIAVAMGLPYNDGLASITRNPASMFGITSKVGTIQIGQKANFVIFNGDPINIHSRIQLISLGTFLEFSPSQF
jgi:hypothetical protein